MAKKIVNDCYQILKNKKPILRFLAWYSLANTILFSIVATRYLIFTLHSDTLFETSFAAYYTFWGKSLVLAFTAFSFIGQVSLLAALPLMIIALPAALLIHHKFVVFLLSILASAVSLVLLIADTIVFSLFRFHLNVTLLSMGLNKEYQFIHFLELSSNEVLYIVLGSAMILVMESLLALFIWKKIIIPRRWRVEKTCLAICSTFLISSYVIFILSVANGNNIFAQQTPNLPLYNHFLSAVLPIKDSSSIVERFSETHFSQPLFTSGNLHYPIKPLVCEKREKPYNILVIGIDTWRADAINPSITPNIDRFTKQSWQFTRHFSGGNSTQAGLFSLFYSLSSNYWTATQEQKKGPVLISELLKQGYQTKVMFSSDMIPPFYKNMFIEIPDLRITHAAGATIPDRDRAITTEFKQFLTARDKNTPFFTFLLYDAAHGYCTTQNIPDTFHANGHDCQRFSFQQANLDHIQHRYQNALHFIDQQVEEVIGALRTQQLLDNTIIIITGDHGEEFDDSHQSYIGHASNYSIYQIQTPLLIHWPHQGKMKWQHQTSHYDIVPTLMNKALGCHNLASDYSMGKQLDDINEANYFLAGSYINMAIIQPHKTTTLQTSGRIRISNEKAHELTGEKPNMRLIASALSDMRKFFLHSS